jgi:hypothetical protein
LDTGQVTYAVDTSRHNVAAAYFSEESYVNYFFTAVRTKLAHLCTKHLGSAVSQTRLHILARTREVTHRSIQRDRNKTEPTLSGRNSVVFSLLLTKF